MEITAERVSRVLNWKGFWCLVLIVIGFFSPITKGPFGMHELNGPKLVDQVYTTMEAARTYQAYQNEMAIEFSRRSSAQQGAQLPKAASYIGYVIYLLPLIAFSAMLNALNGNEKRALSYGRVTGVLTAFWMLIVYGLTQDAKSAMIIGSDIGIGWIMMCAAAIGLIFFSWKMGPKIALNSEAQKSVPMQQNPIPTRIVETTSNFAAQAMPSAEQVAQFSEETKKSFSQTYSHALAFIKVDGLRSFFIGCAVGGFVVYNPALAFGVFAVGLGGVMVANYMARSKQHVSSVPMVKNAEPVHSTAELAIMKDQGNAVENSSQNGVAEI